MNQALTLKPDGIVAGGFDTNEQKVAFDAAAKSGAAVVGWHAGTRPGPEPEAGIFANVTTCRRTSPTPPPSRRSRNRAARPAS